MGNTNGTASKYQNILRILSRIEAKHLVLMSSIYGYPFFNYNILRITFHEKLSQYPMLYKFELQRLIQI